MKKIKLLVALIAITTLPLCGQDGVRYHTEAGAHVASGTFAPYYMTANRYGTVANATGAYLRAGAFIDMDSTQRFSYAAGLELIGMYETPSPVRRWENGSFTTAQVNPQYFRIQQLYADIKYRSLFLSVGMREKAHENPITNFHLSSGNVILSGNARPTPQIQAGFHRFVDIPLTNGWVQIKGDIAYGKFLGDDYLRKHYGYYSSFITTNVFYHYKSLYFRSNPNQPFVFTLGIEDAVQFGGKNEAYENGALKTTTYSPVDLKAFWQAFFPSAGDSETATGDQLFVYGNHVGAIDMAAEYTFKDKSQLRAYTQWIFEDGSGMGKQNGFDGLWGLSYHTNRRSIVSDIVVEYIGLDNQSGAIPWQPTDFPGTSVTTAVSGGDDYYNNFYFNGWQQGGFGIGTPMSPSIMYNTDGYMRYLNTRVRGGHMALQGYIASEWQYRFMASYREAWGTPFIPARYDLCQTSLLLECTYTPQMLEGWKFCASVAGDIGNLIGNNIGLSLSVVKSGNLLSFKKK